MKNGVSIFIHRRFPMICGYNISRATGDSNPRYAIVHSTNRIISLKL